jgi:hypothetical protein
MILLTALLLRIAEVLFLMLPISWGIRKSGLPPWARTALVIAGAVVLAALLADKNERLMGGRLTPEAAFNAMLLTGIPVGVLAATFPAWNPDTTTAKLLKSVMYLLWLALVWMFLTVS